MRAPAGYQFLVPEAADRRNTRGVELRSKREEQEAEAEATAQGCVLFIFALN